MVGSITLLTTHYHSETNAIGVKDEYNGRYTLPNIKKIIGADKFDAAVNTFRGLIELELHRAQKEAEAKISQYQIIKTTTENESTD